MGRTAGRAGPVGPVVSVELLRTAAHKIRETEVAGGDPNETTWAALADWLDAEADEFTKFLTKTLAINLLIDHADEPVEVRLSLGYNTLARAAAVARAHLDT